MSRVRKAGRRRRPGRGVCGVRGLLLAVVWAGLGCEPAGPAAPVGVPDPEVPALVETLTSGEAEAVGEATARVVEAGDVRFVPVLIELLRASQIGIAGREGYEARVVALERLSGEAFGADWLAWAAWQAEHPQPLPPGFVGWKGELLAPLDPAYPSILRDDVPVRGRPELVDWGGAPIDGIPPLDDPEVVPAQGADFLEPSDPVAGLVVQGAARAYPFRVLDWHEVVNDRLGGRSVAVTTCPLCGSAIAYRAEGDGGRRMFSTSGLLYQSNKLLVDRRTRTLWTQLTGRPLLGPLADDPRPLEPLPVVVTTFARWRERHPETTVLSLETGFERDYRPGQPYAGYYASERVLFPVATHREELPAKTHVYGLVHEGVAAAFPLEAVAGARVWNTRVGEAPVVLLSPGTVLTLRQDHPEREPLSWRAGGAVRAYARGAHRFGGGEGGEPLRDEEGRPWAVTEQALVGPEGDRAPRLPGTLAYWFAWQAFHPRTELAEAP